MTDRPSRAKRIDYAELHRSGKRVEIESSAGNSDDCQNGSLRAPPHDSTAELNTQTDSNTPQTNIVLNQTDIVASHSDLVSPQTDTVRPHSNVTPQINNAATHADNITHVDNISQSDNVPHSDNTGSHIDDLEIHSIYVSPHEQNINFSSSSAVDLTSQYINDFSTSKPSVAETEPGVSEREIEFPISNSELELSEDLFEIDEDPESSASEVPSAAETEATAIEHVVDVPSSDSDQEFFETEEHFNLSTSEEPLESTVIETDVARAPFAPSTNDITPVEVELSETSVFTMADFTETLKIDFNTITEDINDFFDENPVDSVSQTIEDHDLINKEVENLRTSYRGKHNQLKSVLDDAEYQAEFKTAYDTNITKFKEYIKKLKESRRTLRQGEEDTIKVKVDIQGKKFNFLDAEVEKKIVRLEKVFNLTSDEWTAMDDADVEQRKKELPERGKDIQSLLPAIKELMDFSPGVDGGEKTVSLRELGFAKMCSLRDKYEKDLEDQYKKRQIEQKKAFNKQKLNVKIPKFQGFDSVDDIYTFQSKFEKVHLNETPRHLLPDVLKNNFLLNPALAVVSDLDDIDKIWARLKESFGDAKLMLTKKVNKLNDINLNPRQKDSAKLANGFSKLINAMKDILHLATTHSLQSHLFYGDTFDKIYRLMGEGRLRKFLSQESLPEEGLPLWNELTKFLEKELKVSQKTALVMGAHNSNNNSNNKNNDDADNSDNNNKSRGGASSSRSSHLTSGPKPPDPCHICGAADHVATSGPGGSKLIQYFACEKFATMTNKERFATLRSKGLCFQCLFPGASRDSGKHKEGRCQRDFTCKHADHDRYINKKHVLVCDEHKEDDSNKKVLEDFKKRCIMRPKQVDSLPDHSKNINIHHQTIILQHNTTPDNVAEPSEEWPSIADEDEAIYILQMI